MPKYRVMPYLAISFTAIIFGFSFLFTKNALDHLQVFQLLGYRFLMAALFITLLKFSGLVKLKIKKKNLGGLFLVALFQPIFYFIFETVGVHLTTAAQSGVVISLVPISAMVFAVLLLGERLFPGQWLAAGLSVLGVLFIVAAQGNGEGQGSLVGVMVLLLAVVAAGLYNVFSRKISLVSTPVETTFVMMWTGAVVFNIIGAAVFLRDGSLTGYITAAVNPVILPDLAFLALVSSIIAFFLFNYSLVHLEASRNAIFLNFVPIVSVWAGVVFRNEPFGGLQFPGMFLIILGAWGINDPRFVLYTQRMIEKLKKTGEADY